MLLEKICSDYGVGHMSNNENMEKRATKTKVEFGHALAVGFNARSVDSLEREATVEPLAACGCRGMAQTAAPESTMKRFPE